MYEEGKAKINQKGEAFLNPAARFSRDLAVAFLKLVVDKKTKILDPTAATGIRGIRYYLETKAKDITLLEINKNAAKDAKKNLQSNKVKAKLLNKSIQEFCNTTRDRFDVIDLDPFGSVAPNLFDIMKVAKDGGYLFLTATDTAVLCGAHEKACVKIYDAKPMHNEQCQEVGNRILIGFVARVAAQFNYGIEVIVSFNYAHYMRMMLRLKGGSQSATDSIKQLGYAYYCSKCGQRGTSRGTFPRKIDCEKCGNPLIVAGKMWVGPLYNRTALSKIIAEYKKNDFDRSGLRLLAKINAELDTPLYYSLSKMTKSMGLPSVSMSDVMEKLFKKGFKVSRTHFDDSSIKSDATIEDVKKTIKNAQMFHSTKSPVKAK